jgi:hypothetical protein
LATKQKTSLVGGLLFFLLNSWIRTR